MSLEAGKRPSKTTKNKLADSYFERFSNKTLENQPRLLRRQENRNLRRGSFGFPEDLLACSFRCSESSLRHQRCGLEYFADGSEFICVDPGHRAYVRENAHFTGNSGERLYKSTATDSNQLILCEF